MPRLAKIGENLHVFVGIVKFKWVNYRIRKTQYFKKFDICFGLFPFPRLVQI
jgi:hypothetical protein